MDGDGFELSQTGFIWKVSEDKGMEHCNGLPTTIRVEAPIGTYGNVPEDNRYWYRSYAYIIDMSLYLKPNTRQDI